MTKQTDRILSKKQQAWLWLLGSLAADVLLHLAQALKENAEAWKNPYTWILMGLALGGTLKATFGDSPTEIEPIEVEGISDRKPKP